MSDGLDEGALRDVAELLGRASSVLFITGAGLSAESGLPTYRGVGGLYEKAFTPPGLARSALDRRQDEVEPKDQGGTHPASPGALQEDGIPIEVALSGPMFAQRPEITFRYLTALEAACRGAAPSEAHRILAELERMSPRSWLLTQNVDGLHHAAGSKNVIEIHGNIHRMRCTTCGYTGPSSEGASPRWSPPCPRCERPMRPDVVLFEEQLPRAALATYERELRRGFEVVMVIGTTATFPYIAGPVFQAVRERVPTIEINPGESDVSHFVTYRFPTRAGIALRALRDRLPP